MDLVRRWIEHWEPEDPGFWERTGRRIALRNLWFSIFVEHVGFSVWTVWSVFVLFMGPAYHVTRPASSSWSRCPPSSARCCECPTPSRWRASAVATGRS